jgi:speckle-type POZ protein
MACDLLAAADRYDLEKLRLMCEEVLYESMDAASVMPTLLVARGRYNCRQLEASCIDYLASDADVYASVRATDEYRKLEESCNSLVVVEVMDKVSTQRLADSSSSFDTARNPRRAKKMSVSTYDASKVVSGTHEMRIPNFGALYRKKRRTYGVGREMQSNTFEIDGYDWKLVVDPAGKNPENEECVYVAAELLTDPGTAGVRASVCFRMDSPNGQDEPTEEDYKQHIFTRYAQSHGNDIIATKDAEQRFLAHDGSLTIRCSIIVTNNSCVATGTPTACGVGAPPPSIARHLKELLANEKGSDVTFLVENREIRAHKLLIAVRSPVLYEMVVGVANKADHVVPVDDMKATVFEAMLHFIYTDELPPMEHLALATSSGTKGISLAMKEITLASSSSVDGGLLIVGAIMAAACRFSLDTMKAKCETLLAGSIKKENAASMLTLARQHNYENLFLKATVCVGVSSTTD